MSDTNRYAYGRVREITPGTTPSNPVFKPVRVNGSPDMGLTITTQRSDEIRSDRQVTDLPVTSHATGGSLPMHLYFSEQEDTFEGGLQSAWVKKPVKFNAVADTTITDVDDASDTYTVDADGDDFIAGHLVRATGFSNAENNQTFKVASSTATTVVGSSLSLTDEAAPPVGAELRVVGFEGAADDIDATATGLSSTVLDFTAFSLTVGEWVKIGGGAGKEFSNSANNSWARISAISANTLTFDVLPAGWSSETSTGSITLRVWIGDYLRNGTTLITETHEQRYLDHNPVTIQYHKGMQVDTITIDAQNESIVNFDVSYVGRSSDPPVNTRFSGATDGSVNTDTPLNSSANVARIAENGSEITGANFVQNLTLNIGNSLRRKPAVGSTGGVGTGSGEFSVTGNMTTYFDNKDIFEKLINNTETSLDFRFKDTDNQILMFDLPRVKYADGKPSNPGKNADVTLPLSFEAIRHKTLGYTLQLQRFYEVG